MDHFSKSSGFTEIAHTADRSLLVTGTSLEDLFIHAARGMYHVMGVTILNDPVKQVSLKLEESDLESLLVSFLSELLFLSEKGSLARDMRLIINDFALSGSLTMIPAIQKEIEIKAVTYNNLIIRVYDQYYQTQIVFDI